MREKGHFIRREKGTGEASRRVIMGRGDCSLVARQLLFVETLTAIALSRRGRMMRGREKGENQTRA